MENPALASAFAIDGDTRTRWGGSFSPGHWLQVDFGRIALVGGVVIRWDSGFTESYLIQSSLDGKQWQTASDIDDGSGNIEYVFFPTVRARYLRLASQPRTADWGVSVLEFEPVASAEVPRLSGVIANGDTAALWTQGHG